VLANFNENFRQYIPGNAKSTHLKIISFR